MGRASSKKKIDRAARAAGRPGAGRNMGWPLMIGGLVILGVLLIVVTVSGVDAERVPPRPGDHWHAAYGIYNCDTFLDPLVDQTEDVSGVHTHSDGLIHMHPFATQYAGDNTTLGLWGETVGLRLTDTTVEAGAVTVKNGDDCGGQPGKVEAKVWSDLADEDGRLLEGDFADYAPQDGELVTIAFVPEGTEIPRPPDYALANLPNPSDVTGQPPALPSTTTTIPAETTTTAPPG
jgi:hypothetical protein